MSTPRTHLDSIAANATSLRPRVLAALRTIDARLSELDGYSGGRSSDGPRGSATSTPVERASLAALPITTDRDTIVARVVALDEAIATLLGLCDRHTPIQAPTQCVGGNGDDWWSTRRTTAVNCTNWASVNPAGQPNRGGLCDACDRSRLRHESARHEAA